MEQNNSKHMEVLGKLKETNGKYNLAVEENIRLNKELVRYKDKYHDVVSKNIRLIEEVDELGEQITQMTTPSAARVELEKRNAELYRENVRLEKELQKYTDSYNAAVSKSIRLQEQVEELNNEKNRLNWEIARLERFPEVDSNSGLSDRDHIAIAALEGCLSAKGWHPEYIIPSGGGHLGGQRAADAAAESAYKYADAMLKARVK